MPTSKRTSGVKKADLISNLANSTGLNKSQVNSVMDGLVEEIRKAIKAGHEIPLLGLMKVLKVPRKARPARPGRNPQTNKPITIPAKPAGFAIRVKVMKGLKEMI